MKFKTLLIVFAALNVVALFVYSYFWFGIRHAEQAEKISAEMKIANAIEKAGVVSTKDYMEIRQLRERVKADHHLGEADFEWLIQLFNKPTLSDTPYAAGNKRTWALGPMLDAQLTPAQTEKMYTIALPMLSSTDKTADDSDKVYGCNVMKKLKDKRAIPAILPLLSDPRPIVVKRAKEALDSMGYKAG